MLAKLDFYIDELTKIQEELIGKLEKVVVGLSKLSDVELLRIGDQIDFFDEMNTLGYSTLISRVSNVYDDEIALVFSELSKRQLGQVSSVSVIALEQMKSFDMDYLTDSVRQYSTQLKNTMLRSLIARESVDEILSTMKVDFGPGQFITTSRFKFLVNDAFARFDHVVKAKVYEEFSETKFIYTGPNDGNTRDVCKQILQKFRRPLTKKEIDELKIPPQKDKSQFRGFVDRGGYNCRHDWIKVS